MLKSRIAGATMLLLASSCAVQNKLEVRPAGASLVHTAKPQSARIAEAKAHLALGNVALALEQYRIAAREDANSVEALSGMANCYQLLGRPELAQRQIELALAIQPKDTALLTSLAMMLDAQGLNARAAMVRAEISAGSTLAVATDSAFERPAELSQVQVEKAARDTAGARSQPVAASMPVEPKVNASASAEARATSTVERVAVAPAVATAPAVASPAKTITVQLPKIAPVTGAMPVGKSLGRSVTVSLAPAHEPSTAKNAAKAMTSAMRPQLERLSLGEVALRTTGSVQWTNLLPAAKSSGARPSLLAASSQLKILNGARVQGLAGSARAMLLRRGWRSIEVSDARKVHAVSVLYAPRHRARLASRLAAQFSFPVKIKPSHTDLILVLGANAQVRRAGA